MECPQNRKNDTVWREISDADDPPLSCPKCGSRKYIRESYFFRDLQELGSPSIARRVRYESIIWKCKECQSTFVIHNPAIPPRSPFMSDVVEYTTYRVLKKGDSARRVAADLNELHQVEISADTISAWIRNEYKISAPSLKSDKKSGIQTKFSEKNKIQDFSGVLGIDGTFKGVKQKKNEPREDGNELQSLHLTHLQDGRLVAYWHAEKPKKKSQNSSKNSK